MRFFEISLRRSYNTQPKKKKHDSAILYTLLATTEICSKKKIQYNSMACNIVETVDVNYFTMNSFINFSRSNRYSHFFFLQYSYILFSQSDGFICTPFYIIICLTYKNTLIFGNTHIRVLR